MKTQIAIALGRLSKFVLALKNGGGSSFPGKLAEKIDKDILKNVSKDYKVVMVTGTNGKTLTTALISNIVRLRDGAVVTNPTGANLKQGIITTFITSPDLKKANVAVLEIDEATLKYITPYIKPDIIVFTNVFRDQMDRYGEIYSTYQQMVDGAALAPEALILANGDLPIFNSKSLVNPIKYYGFDHQEDGFYAAHYNTDGVLCPKCFRVLRYKQITYANQGKYFCQKCDFKRPDLAYYVEGIHEMTPTSSTFSVGGHQFSLPVGGYYNIYNALAAYSVAKELGIEDALIEKGFAEIKKVFGRQESFKIGEKKVILNIMKNPVGLNQLIDLIALDKDPFSLVMLLNDRPADGTDVSWIWDGQFEELMQMCQKPLLLSGLRVEDLAKRCRIAGADTEEMIIEKDLSQLAAKIEKLPTNKVYILATYTAVLDLRRTFKEQGYIEESKA